MVRNHQETPVPFLEVESEPKGNLLPWKDTGMRTKENPYHHQDMRAQYESPVTQKMRSENVGNLSWE